MPFSHPGGLYALDGASALLHQALAVPMTEVSRLYYSRAVLWRSSKSCSGDEQFIWDLLNNWLTTRLPF